MKLIDIFKKQGGWNLIENWLRTGVLPYAIIQGCLLGKSRKGLEILRLGVTLKKYHKLKKTYLPILKKWDKQNHSIEVKSNRGERKIWLCWMQGMDHAPWIVKKCFESIKDNIKDREIVVITSQNYLLYTDFPDYILDKYKRGIISHTHFSDLLRVELLSRYGGTWIDSTVFCSGGNIPKYMLDSDFFIFQNLKPGSDGSILNISSWFMTASANSKIIYAIRFFLYTYWKINNSLIDYFLIHYFFAIVRDFYEEEWKKIIPYPNSLPHIFQLRQFEQYDDDIWSELKKQCPFHKLTYKVSKSDMERKGTYYDVIINK